MAYAKDDGKRYNANHYSLEMIIAVGFKVNSERAVQFRKWVNQIAKDYTIKGWVMDVERADHTREHMGLTTWADAPDGKIKKSDVTVVRTSCSFLTLINICWSLKKL